MIQGGPPSSHPTTDSQPTTDDHNFQIFLKNCETKVWEMFKDGVQQNKRKQAEFK